MNPTPRDTRSVELFRQEGGQESGQEGGQEGGQFRSVCASVDGETFRIDTQDLGPLVERIWGDADYEFWTTVPREAWGDLLMAFAQELLAGAPDGTDRLREICRKHGVDHRWDSWA